MPGKTKPEGKVKPKPAKPQKYNVAIGFNDLDPNYSMYTVVVSMDVLMDILMGA